MTWISPSAWRELGDTFVFEDLTVFYRREGSGPALLLLHGFPTASWDWHAVWPELTARFDVMAPDLIGLGYSAKPTGRAPYSVARQAQMHEAVCAHLGVTQVHALAHDLGDTVLQELLARQLDRQVRQQAGLRIVSAVFLNGGLFPETHRPRWIQRALLGPLGPLIARLSSKRRLAATMTEIFGSRTPPSPALIDAFWELLTHDGGRGALPGLLGYLPERSQHRARWVGALGTVPTHVIDGPEDPISGQHIVDRLAELLPDVGTTVLPGLGHYPHLEDPQAVLDAFLAFHQDLARSG